MNEPKNHHYVSQCHQKKHFNFDDKKIYIYDKELNNHYHKKTTKTLFSKEHGNTINSNGIIDQTTREKELQLIIENDFNKNIDVITDFLDHKNGSKNVYSSLCSMALIGILGEMRNPLFNEELLIADNRMKASVFSRKLRLEQNINLNKELVFKILENKRIDKYPNIISYVKMANKIIESMEPFDFMVYSIESDDYFLLPDNSGFQVRGQLKKHPNNVINEIIQVGIPITDKIFILATSKSIGSNNNGIQFINDDNSKMVYEINKDLFSFARKGVACKSEAFLKKTVVKILNSNDLIAL